MFFKGLWGYLPANILQGIIGFATLMVFTRVLTPEAYGQYALAFGLSSLVYTLVFTWLEAAMARFFIAESRDEAEAPALYGTVYRSFTVVAVVFAVVATIVLLAWPSSGSLKTAIALALMTLIPRSLIRLVQEQRRAEGRVGAASIVDMIQTAGGFGIGVCCALIGVGGASPVVGTGLIAALTLPFVVRQDWGRAVRGRFDGLRAQAYARYGFPLAASLVLTLALYTADRFLIAAFLNEAQAGAYHAGYSLASRILDVLFIWFGAAGTPAMVQALETGGEGALKTAARQQLTTMAFILFPAVGGLVMVAPALGGIVIGEGLRDKALSVTPLISLGALFSGLNTYYFLQAFTLAKKTRLLVVAMAVPAAANIALNLALIPPFGLMGAAWATALSFGIGLVASWLLGLRALRLPIAAGELFLTAASAIFMMAVVSLLPSCGGVVELVAKAGTGGMVYAVLAWILNLNGIRAAAGPRLVQVYHRLRAKVFA
ncbi:oligosaccharide flippase family protein [Asticcacaulis solisilvae]|uniref:oligosaccharide flippase family protein n=1 Tax=Asticcacaulis solisilvae TaxID=1217274 RepID=UPI003FD84F2B